MAHCPQCGKAAPFEGAVACPFCGAALGPALRPPAPPGRTMVGVAAADLGTAPPGGNGSAARPPEAKDPAPAPVAGAAGSKANRTLVGMPAQPLPGRAAPVAPQAAPGPAPVAPVAPSGTIVGMSMTRPLGSNAVPGALPPVAPQPAGGTLLGVARPGIAPLSPGERKDAEVEEEDAGPPGGAPFDYAPAEELGATIGPKAGKWPPAPAGARARDAGMRHGRVRIPRLASAPAPQPSAASRKRLIWLLGAAGGLLLVALLVAIFWPSAPPLTARAKADADGREGAELRCPSCPDGTKVSIGEASAEMRGGVALVPLPSLLSLGENKKKVVIDRPGSGRDETVGVVINVAYRIRPDLTTLKGERPSIQIVAEAAQGTAITIDGKALPVTGGRAVQTIDVTDACTGQSAEAKTISRQIPYTVVPETGPAEQGMVSVSVGIVPLTIEAPGPHVTIDGQSFVLAGKTMKGAEVTAAGRPIAVRPDGTFAQVMNVSSVGATQLEVRASVAGLAPRLSMIRVRRVPSLDAAAKEFTAESPIDFGPLLGGIGAQVGKAVVLAGEVVEARKQGYQTVILLDVAQSSGCPKAGTCTARLVQGADSPVKKGDLVRVYGHVSRAFSVEGRADVPEIEVDFLTKGGK
ncbi:MAG: hypothetical protein U0359_06975 [Byssovorax sp.]